MRKLLCCIFAIFTIAANAQEEKTIVLKAFQDVKNSISEGKYENAHRRLKDVEFLQLYKDSIAYYHEKIDILEGKYDHEGEMGSSGLRFVVRKGKCGYVDASGKEVIPIKYDYERNNLYHRGYEEKLAINCCLVRVKLNGKYGFVNQKGIEVIPTKYDEASQEYFASRNSVVEVLLGNKYGLIDSKGKEIIPCLYESVKGWDADGPFVVKKEGKYAYMSPQGKLLTDFKYTSANYYFGFGITRNLAVVSIKEEYGYINEKGKEEIPLKYQFAETFSDGLAAVVQDNKVGFINEEGDLIIPHVYDVSYSHYWSGKSLTWSHFENGIACVMKNGKWGLIDKRGNKVTDFKYDTCKSWSSLGQYDMSVGDKIIYVDIMGHEYNSKKERSDHFPVTMLEAAEHGNADAQWYVSWNYYDGRHYPKDIIKAYEWCLKAAEAGEMQAQNEMGIKYYYGRGCEQNYEKAFKWFVKSAKSGMLESLYYVGWMYEHGQGVLKDKDLAIKNYKQAAMSGHEESIKRLELYNINIDE